jgi:hypothetical protein
MRLINTDTLELKDFLVEEIPPYAILSHTWGASEDEVSCQDWKTPQRKSKEGFRKIEYCCFQARSDGLHWAWVDT